jgi:uncharacterized protein (DUF433 family)
MQVIGCDFSSSPSKRKPIVFAVGACVKSRVQLSHLDRVESLDGFSDWLVAHTDWIGGFDLPFGLPRELVEHLHWPTDWAQCIRHYAALSREDIRATFKAFCDSRPVGGKFAHRATDLPAGSSPSMKWVNPPVAYMLHAGVPRLLAAGVHFPALHAEAVADQGAAGQSRRVALEAYPGLLAREVLAHRSYKSDYKLKQTSDRLIARKDLITALENGQTRLASTHGPLRLKLTHAQRDTLVGDASGDSLDAVLCMLQAAWAKAQHAAGHASYGLPAKVDALEGWIVTS